MAIATVGIVMSYKAPKKEHHFRATLILVACGLLGTGIMSWTRIRSEAAHNADMAKLNDKMDEVGDQNTRLGNFLLSAKETGKLSEADRRKGIEEVLRNKYILSHDPIDSDILAGLKMPPEEWMNEQLRQMKESWTFKNASVPIQIVQQIAQEEKKARVVFSFYQDDMARSPITVKLDPLENSKFTVSIAAIALDAPADDLTIWIRECKTCEWVEPSPPGFVPVDSDHFYDRETILPELPQNASTQKWTFTIQVPQYPKAGTVPIGCYYACKNCAPVDWKKPQTLWVTQTMQSGLKLLSPSIVYTPEPVRR